MATEVNKYRTVLVKEGSTIFVDEWKHEKRETEIRVQKRRKLFKGELAIEIGGPSDIFSKSGLFPVYGLLRGIDNYNFSANTFWMGKIPGGSRVVFADDSSDHYFQHIGEGANLPVES
ncbi:unnamed protein product, partial [marine sediment metagenome]